MLVANESSAASSANVFAGDLGEPALDNQRSAAAFVIRIDMDGIDGTVERAGSAFHTGARISKFCLLAVEYEHLMRTDGGAHTAPDTPVDIKLQVGNIFKVSKILHSYVSRRILAITA